jgi:hypothetical protein
MHHANAAMAAPGDDFDPAGLLEPIQSAEDLTHATKDSGLLELLSDTERDAYLWVLEHMPAALDAGVLAAMRSALSRGLRVQLVWQEAASYEVRLWESSGPSEVEGQLDGILTVHLRSPEPPEPTVF